MWNPVQRVLSVLLAGALVAGASGTGTRSQAAEVSKPKEKMWSHGYVIGRPIKASYRRSGKTLYTIKTYEMEISGGSFLNNPVYASGSNVSVSTEDEEIFDRFQNLDAEKNYVFEIHKKAPWPFNFEIESSKYQVIAIHEIDEDRLDAVAALPESIPSDEGSKGNYVKDGIRKGRILSVFRWGRVYPNCEVAIKMGGVRSTASKGAVDSVVHFRVYSEEACQWAQTALFAGKTVVVRYDEELFEIRNLHSKIVREFSFAQDSTEKAEAAPSSSLDYQEIKRRLMEDPEFREFVRGLMDL